MCGKERPGEREDGRGREDGAGQAEMGHRDGEGEASRWGRTGTGRDGMNGAEAAEAKERLDAVSIPRPEGNREGKGQLQLGGQAAGRGERASRR